MSLLYLIVLILDILAIVNILKGKQDNTKKAVWVAIIVLLPFVGLLLWWFLGQKK